MADTGGMGKRRERQTFAEIVAEERRKPRLSDLDRYGPGFTLDRRLVAPDGRVYVRTDEDVTAEQAVELLRAGAAVVLDSCGCAGGCPLEWPGPDEVERLCAAGRPVTPKRGLGELYSWRSEDGHALIYVAGDVRWE